MFGHVFGGHRRYPWLFPMLGSRHLGSACFRQDDALHDLEMVEVRDIREPQAYGLPCACVSRLQRFEQTDIHWNSKSVASPSDRILAS
jgi:hypothetical protein